MNLLLLLSALLSALTGAGVGVRRADVAQSVAARSIAAQPARTVAAMVAQRPPAALPSLVASAVSDRAVGDLVSGSIDLWANRRRE